MKRKNDAAEFIERIERIRDAYKKYLESNFEVVTFTIKTFEGIDGKDIINAFFKENYNYSCIYHEINYENLPNGGWNEYTTISYAKTPERIDLFNFQKTTGIYVK